MLDAGYTGTLTATATPQKEVGEAGTHAARDTDMRVGERVRQGEIERTYEVLICFSLNKIGQQSETVSQCTS